MKLIYYIANVTVIGKATGMVMKFFFAVTTLNGKIT